MKSLKVCRWVLTVLCLVAAVFMILPIPTMESFFENFGIEPLPDTPIFIYITCLLSATYAVVGVFLVILAFDPMKYGAMVPFAGVSTLFIGLVCGTVGVISVMPNLWFLGDDLSGIIVGLLILIFWQKVKKGCSAETQSSQE